MNALWNKSRLVKELNDWIDSDIVQRTVYEPAVAESQAYAAMQERKFSNEYSAQAAGYTPHPHSPALHRIGFTLGNRAVAALVAGHEAGWSQLALSVAYEAAANRLQMRIFQRMRLPTTGIAALRSAWTLASAITIGDQAFCRDYVRFLLQVDQQSAFLRLDSCLLEWLLPLAAQALDIETGAPMGAARIAWEYAQLATLWKTTDLPALRTALLAAADRHVAQARTSTNTATYDFDDMAYAVFPGEILAVLRLRRWRGLENPALEHPLLGGLLGQLPSPREIRSDDLLAAVIAKADRIYPDKS